ncbi:MAG: class I tRNA ligase family protein, partial [Chloroflexi bacterium]|nr:class I tRNA ligase family protein [Chloroflexota bacterium]
AYQLGEAGRQVTDFLWGEYCDWYIEMAKIRLRSHDGRHAAEPSPLPVLVHVLEKSLRLLHPVMPFITEELWQGLVGRFRAEGAWPWESIMVAPYPRVDQEAVDLKAEWQMGLTLDLIRGVRSVRSEYHVEPAHWIPATVVAGEVESLIVSLRALIEGLARVRPLRVAGALAEKPVDCATLVVEDLEVFLPLAGLADLASERRRLTKELAAVRREIERAEGKLGDRRFVERAPAAVVEAEQGKLRGHRVRLDKIEERLRDFG